jgi:hypothetical protein
MLYAIEDRLEEALVAPCREGITLGQLGFTVRFCSDEESTLAWTEWFLSPAFAVVDKPAEWSVVFIRDDALYESLQRLQSLVPGVQCSPYLQHGESMAPSFEYRVGELAILADGETNTFWAAAPRGKALVIVSKRENIRALTTPMRAIRELASIHHQMNGSAIVHAAAYEENGSATIVTAPKHGGKTTHLMKALVRGAKLIANDRVLLHECNGSVFALGIPTIVSLRLTTLDLFPGILDEIDRQEMHFWRIAQRPVWPDRRNVSPLQLCSLLHADATETACVRRVLFLQLGDGTPEQLPPDIAIERLHDAIFDYRCGRDQSFVAGLFADTTSSSTQALSRLFGILCQQATSWEYPRETVDTVREEQQVKDMQKSSSPVASSAKVEAD